MAAQPAHIVPGRRDGQHAVEYRAATRRQPGQERRLGDVHRGYAVRQGKARTLFTIAQPRYRRIHGQHQGAIARRLGALRQCQGRIPVALPVQLEPQRAGRRLGDSFQRCGGERAEHRGAAHHPGAQGAGRLALGVKQVLVGHRRQQDGVLQIIAEQSAAGMAAAQIA
ncbi:hypothetical protein FQZ97_1093220 [compost metagenome]